jgi:hypothetical protein
MILRAALVALAAEFSFAIGVVAGALLGQLVGTAFNFVVRSGRSLASTLLQGLTLGLVSGFAAIAVAIWLGRYLGVPDSWLIWLALVPPAIGEFGHWMNRFSLRHLGRPNKGLFMPLGRVHAAAWELYKTPTFHYYRYVLNVQHGENPESEKYGREAYQTTMQDLGKAIIGMIGGVGLVLWLAMKFLFG